MEQLSEMVAQLEQDLWKIKQTMDATDKMAEAIIAELSRRGLIKKAVGE